jgi:hypothetical protein
LMPVFTNLLVSIASRVVFPDAVIPKIHLVSVSTFN